MMKIKLKGDRYDLKVWLNDKELEIGYSQTLRLHSQEFSWGRTDSGCAQLALAICQELFGNQKALEVYQNFKQRYISTIPMGSFNIEITIDDEFKKSLTVKTIRKAIEYKNKQLDVEHMESSLTDKYLKKIKKASDFLRTGNALSVSVEIPHPRLFDSEEKEIPQKKFFEITCSCIVLTKDECVFYLEIGELEPHELESEPFKLNEII